jgi:S-disulfanyl-L-cysteine oxidoreductase SoxD
VTLGRRCLAAALAATSAIVAAALGAAAVVGWPLARPPTALAAHFADAEDGATAALAKQVYMRACASCHGRNLQGQPLWQLADEYAGRRAPAHDETGHTWQHSDEDLFAMTKYGRFPAAPADAVSYMPAFAGVLDDREILAAIGFLKARWPIALRASQALLNPGHAGMPQQASTLEWRLPPICRAVLRQKSVAPIAEARAAPQPTPP